MHTLVIFILLFIILILLFIIFKLLSIFELPEPKKIENTKPSPIKEDPNLLYYHSDSRISKRCQNVESYGVICIKCGRCGRKFDNN